MFRACSRCGRIHPKGYECDHNRPRRTYQGGEERDLRNSHAWHSKSLDIRERAQHLCEVCRDHGRYVYEGLEVHHITKVKDDPSALLDDQNLVCLCTACHKMADRGELDEAYLRMLAKRRDDR